jgi:fatty acid desaturase
MKTMRQTPLLVGVAAGIVVGLLLSGASLAALVPWAIILLCPVMMLLMMRGMGHDAGHDRRDQQAEHPAPPSEHLTGGR